MNEDDRRLLLLASVSQKEHMLQKPSLALESERSLTALASRDSSYISHLKNSTAATAYSRKISMHENDDTNMKIIYPDVAAALPRINHHCNLSGPDGHLNVPQTQNIMPLSTQTVTSSLPPTPSLMANNLLQCQQDTMQMWGHECHPQIMEMALAGLSHSTLMSSLQSRPHLLQQIQMQNLQQQQQQQQAREELLVPSDEGPGRKKRRRSVESAANSSRPHEAKNIKDVPSPSQRQTKKDDTKPPIVFPNQELYSQMLQIKALRSKPRNPQAPNAPSPPPPPSPLLLSTTTTPNNNVDSRVECWNPLLLEGEDTVLYPDQEQALLIQNRFLQAEMKKMQDQREKQLQKYMEQLQRRRHVEDGGSLSLEEKLFLEQYRQLLAGGALTIEESSSVKFWH